MATQHRGERKGGCGGNHHHNGYHPTQLTEEHTGHTGYERQWEEHRNQGEGGSHHRNSHFVGAVHGGLLWIGTALNVGGHVFEHHNGVVHHHTDGDRQCGERHNVERIAGGKQVDKRSNQRDRNGDGNDDGGTPASQEHKHHKHHEYQGIHHRFFQRSDGVANVVAGIHNVVELHIGRQVFLNTGQGFLNFVGNIHRIGTGLLLHHNHSTFLAIGVGFLGTFFQRIVDACHITQAHHGAIFRAHHQIAHFLRVFKFALHTN